MMKLTHLTDKFLLSETKILVGKERTATTVILHHLREIDRRKLFCEAKCESLYAYCTRELGYAPASAQRRIDAARLIEEIPEIEEKIETGELSLTNISMVKNFFKDSDTETKKEVLKEIEGKSKAECERMLFELTGKETPSKETKKRLSDKKTKVSYILSDETLEAIEEVKKLIGRKLESDELFKLFTRALKEKIEKEKFKQTDRPKKSSTPTSASESTSHAAEVGRYIPASVKREVYKRDKKCKNCGSTHNLNFDHIDPYALGGQSTTENIRLLCFQCNQRARYEMRL